MSRMNPSEKIKNSTSKSVDSTKDTSKQDKKKNNEPKRKPGQHTSQYYTHDKHPLTPMEAKFINLYIETGNQRQSVLEAGYKTKSPSQVANKLLKKDHISKEIAYRLQKLEEAKTASAKEILEFYTRVMRGEEQDQFGLETPISERLKAANELAKRKIDIPNRVAGKEANATVTISLNWEGMDNGTEETGDE